MLKVLSIQSAALGHKVYCNSMRDYFRGIEDIQLSAYWSRHGRSIPTRVFTRLCEARFPLLGAPGRNLDYRRARAEWAHGRMSRLLTQRLLREDHFDLLHFHTQVLAFGCGKLMRSIPTIVTIDMTAYQVAREYSVQYPHTYGPNVAMESEVFHNAVHIVTWSEWAKKSVLEDCGIPEAKVTVVSPGVRLDTFWAPQICTRALPKLLFVGGDFSRKGGWDLLEVFSKHFSERAELHIVTAQNIESTRKNVFVHNGISAYSQKWHALFQQSDIFVLPTYAEAFGLVFQEAAGYGLALVGSRLNAIPEMLVDRWNGLLVEPGDRDDLRVKLTTLLDDPHQLLLMRRRSREMAVDRFDAATNFMKLAEVFKWCAGHAKP